MWKKFSIFSDKKLTKENYDHQGLDDALEFVSAFVRWGFSRSFGVNYDYELKVRNDRLNDFFARGTSESNSVRMAFEYAARVEVNLSCGVLKSVIFEARFYGKGAREHMFMMSLAFMPDGKIGIISREECPSFFFQPQP